MLVLLSFSERGLFVN